MGLQFFCLLVASLSLTLAVGIPEGFYCHIINRSSGDLLAMDYENGNLIYAAPGEDGYKALWTFTRRRDGSYVINNVNNNLMLTQKFTQRDYFYGYKWNNPGANTWWRFCKQNGHYTIRNVYWGDKLGQDGDKIVGYSGKDWGDKFLWDIEIVD